MKSSVVLLGLAIGLVGLLVVLEKSDPTDRDEPVLSTEPAVRRSGREAVGMSIRAFRGGETIELERDGVGAWALVEPIRDRASVAVIASILQQVEAAELTLDLEPEAVSDDALSQRGLGDPLASLRIGWSDGEATSFEFGETALSDQEVYVRRAGSEAVYRTSLGFRNVVTSRNQSALRDQLIFETRAGGLTRLRMTRSYGAGPQVEARSREVVLERQPNGRFDLETDRRRTRAVTGESLRIVQRILGLRTSGFPLGAPDFEDPIVVIEATGGVGTERVEFFDVGSAFVARSNRRPVVVGVEMGAVESLLGLDFEVLRARSLWTQPVEDFDSLRVERDGEGFTIGTGPLGRLELQRPVRSNLNGRASDDLLAALRRMVAIPGPDGILDDPDAEALGLGQGAIEVEIRSRVGRRRGEVVRIGRNDEGRVFGQRGADDFTVELQPEVLEILERPWTDYLDRKLLVGTRPPSTVRVLRVIRAPGSADGEPVVEDFTRDPETGSFVEPRAGEVLFAVLDAQARSIRTDDLIATTESELQFQLLGEQDRLLVELKLFEIGAGEDESASVFATVSGRDGLVFELKSLLVDAIRSLR